MTFDRLPRSFYRQPAIPLARSLLGQTLVRVLEGQRLTGVIVETEAYLGVPDRAAHTFGGRRTARNESMWGDGGQAYVYFTYGMHHCLNVVAGTVGQPVAVLLRALEPIEGIGAMQRHRPAAKRLTDLCSGPAKLAAALVVNRHLDGADLVEGEALFIERRRWRCHRDADIIVTPRIGVDYAGDWRDRPLRFFLKGNRHVSAARGDASSPLGPRR